MDTAKSRYDFLTSDRSNFLDMAREAANLTLPYRSVVRKTTRREHVTSRLPGNQLEVKVL